MIVTHKLKMDLLNRGTRPVIDVMQDDRYSRNIAISLFSGHEAFTLPEGCNVLVRYKKSDGVGGIYDTLPDGNQAWLIEGNAVTVALAPQVCTVAGNVLLTVMLLAGQQQLSSFEICLDVRPDPISDFESEKYMNIAAFLPQVMNAAVGQYLKVAAVDAFGKVSQLTTEAVTASGGGSSDALIVNATPNGYLYDLDCPVAQIRSCFEAGQMVYCRKDGAILLPLVMCTEDVILFAGLGYADMTILGMFVINFAQGDMVGTYGGHMRMATMENIPTIPADLPNPYSLEFIGAVNANYNGSTPVTVRIPVSVPVPATASVGQVMAVKAVTQTNVLAAWEAIDPGVVTSAGGKKFKIIVDESGNLSTQAVN
jgi:hypothetical protein